MSKELTDPLNPNNYTLLNSVSVIKTYTGRWFDVFDPDPNSIHINDIAISLSRQCRFASHTQIFYSVAEHSIECASIVKNKHKLSALLHDASEAYLVDIPRPIKKKLIGYKEIEDKVMSAIAIKFGFDYPLHESVKKADEERLVAEWELLMHKNEKTPNTLSQYMAQNRFIGLFHTLTKNKFIHN